ncbi:ribosome biogenesis protein bop1-A-like [Panonychus citri]|uniref:ribosome biogenesis protein bop1-A-like n=1 Tax=Panonychus citri TaxID=50023 RepID=UPI00230707E2|nr:ribosome biogenesis protein bop1-A-like [Panonychus citri]
MDAVDQIKFPSNMAKKRKVRKVNLSVDKYEVDSSDEEDLRNTVGNIPIEWYNEYDHIGYDWDGKKIMKPQGEEGGEIEDFINKMEDPYYWRTVDDKSTGKKIILTDADIDLIQRIRRGDFPDPNYNPYPNHIDTFSHETMLHPVVEYNLRKAQFRASISEKRLISKYISKYKNAKRLGLLKQRQKKDKNRFSFHYDLWSKEGDPNHKRHRRHIPAPKLLPPGHEESYNPPPEYLFDEEELKKWTESEPEERKIKFIPERFERLRHVPRYKNFIKERFDRCQDLYLCPRMVRHRVNVNPEDLIPKLPSPKDLYPFPCILSLIYTGHTDVIRSIDVEPEGQFMVSGSDDCSIRIWEVSTGRCFKKIDFDSPIDCVKWCPLKSRSLIVACSKFDVYIVSPEIGNKTISSETEKFIQELVDKEKEESANMGGTKRSSYIEWTVVTQESDEILWNKGIRFIIKHAFEVTQVSWHHKGDYFASVAPQGANKAVVVHQLSKLKSQVPFSKSKGIVRCVAWHPNKPLFFVATQKHVKVYNLIKQMLTKKLYANSNLISSIAIHPQGDNLIIGCFDVRLSWFDLELSDKPYKTMRYHKKSVRQVAYHPRYPLFASASDDASTIISHGRVFDDLNESALIVPVKVLKGHKLVDGVGVLDCCFHPKQPWIFTSGADATIRLYTH